MREEGRYRQQRVRASSASAIAADARPSGEPLERVVIRSGPNVDVIPVGRVDYVLAQDDYVAYVVGGKEFLKQQTLNEVENQLDSARFVRIHRSHILNVDRLARIGLYAKDSQEAILKDGKRLAVSRSGYARLQEFL